MTRTIGIDLGTYNSAGAVALGRNQQPVMVESRHGRTPDGKNFPSFVLFDANGRKQAVGKRAKAERVDNPELVIWGVKRLVGLSFQQALDIGELDLFPYEKERGPGDGILIKVGEERYSPSHIMEFILREIKEDAENAKLNRSLGGSIERAVISVPAYFKSPRTSPIVEAAKRAGFLEVDTIAEPTAAALAYGLTLGAEAKLLTFDIGAGTLDVTVMLLLQHGNELLPGELCTSGHERLGGIDMDRMLAHHAIEKYGLQEVVADVHSKADLVDIVERTKRRLSTHDAAPLDLPDGRTVDLTRSELEDVLRPLLERCRGPIQVALQQAGLSAAELDHVLFVGGPSHMPCIRRLVKDELAKLGAGEEVLTRIESGQLRGIDPMECVAQGAALQAARVGQLVGKRISEGYGTRFGDYYSPIIKDNSNYPISGKGGLVYSNPNALEVSVPLVSRRADAQKTTPSQTVYQYQEFGTYSLSIGPTGDLPEIDIFLRVSDDKRPFLTLVHRASKQKLELQGLDMLQGKEIALQEHTPPKPWTEEQIMRYKEAVSARTAGWTTAHLERLIHASRAALDLVKDASSDKVRKAKEELESAVKTAVDTDHEDPNRDCPSISNRAKELVNVLSLPEVGQITQKEFLDYLNQLTTIAKS